MIVEVAKILEIDDPIGRNLALLRLLKEVSINDSREQLNSLVEKIEGAYEKTEGYLILYSRLR